MGGAFLRSTVVAQEGNPAMTGHWTPGIPERTPVIRYDLSITIKERPSLHHSVTSSLRHSITPPRSGGRGLDHAPRRPFSLHSRTFRVSAGTTLNRSSTIP
jgi:hypothetical protein